MIETICIVSQLYFNEKYWQIKHLIKDLYPPGSDGKESACDAGDPGSNPESGRSPGKGNGNPL